MTEEEITNLVSLKDVSIDITIRSSVNNFRELETLWKLIFQPLQTFQIDLTEKESKSVITSDKCLRTLRFHLESKE